MKPVVDLGDVKLPLMVFGGPVSNLSATKAAQHKAEELA